MMDDPRGNGMSLTQCEELLDDYNRENDRLQQKIKRTQNILSAAIFLTSIEPAVVETMIESANHPDADPARQREVAKALDGLFAAVKAWRKST